MIGYTYIILLATIFQIINAEEPDIPPECRIHPSLFSKMPHECCKLPPLFAGDEFESCGFVKPKPDEHKHRGPPGPPGKQDCTKQICLLKKHDIVGETGEINIEGASKFLDEWSKANPDFAAAGEVVKQKCLVKDIPGPSFICDAEKLMFCATHHMVSECPKWEEDEACEQVKNFITNCKPK